MKRMIRSNKVLDWYNTEDFPNISGHKLDLAANIDWNINMEDLEFALQPSSPDLEDVVSVRYLNEGEEERLAQELGYEGGYVYTYKDGSKRMFAWLPYPHNLDPLEEIEEVSVRKFQRMKAPKDEITNIQSSSDASEEWISEEDREFAESEDFDLTGDDMEDFWNKYLTDAENPVLEELEVATEPSGQGSLATMYLVDDSGQGRFDSIGIDWWEWSDNEINMALDSASAKEYSDKFKAYVKEICGL